LESGFPAIWDSVCGESAQGDRARLTRGCVTGRWRSWSRGRAGTASSYGRATAAWPKRAAIMVGPYSHAHQFKRARRELKFLRTRLGGVIRDIRRKIASQPALEARLPTCRR
jgi:transposase, IS5 family